MPCGLYIHIPFCNQKCRYCNFCSVPLSGQPVRQVCDAIIREFESRCDSLQFDTIYIGGGSPCSINSQIYTLIEQLQKRLFAMPVEWTVEISPENANKVIFKNLYKLGINRVSIGVQSFNQNLLDFLGRRYSVKKIFDTIKFAHKAGFENISIDLIFAIPNQTIMDWQNTIEKAVKLSVPHISAYSLSFEDDTEFGEMFKSGIVKSVDQDVDRIMYETAYQYFYKFGIKQYEISNFAKKGFQCRHNLKYWQNSDYIGLGPSAGSFSNRVRTLNNFDIKTYLANINKSGFSFDYSRKSSNEDLVCETAVLGLRKREGINLKQFLDITGFDFVKTFKKEVDKHLELKNLILTNSSVRLSLKAIPIADSIFADFSSLE